MSVEVLVAIPFANSRYAVRGQLREGIGTAAELAEWLREHGFGRQTIAAGEVKAFVTLRDAIRESFTAGVHGEPPAAPQLAVLNAAAAAAPYWPVLGANYERTEETGSGPLVAARAALARDAIAILAGPLRAELRRCGAPGCVLFFVKDHPRREWCCAHCGNRARAARHYRRHKASPPAMG